MKKSVRILSLVMIVALMASLFGGCKAASDNGTTAAGGGTTAAQTGLDKIKASGQIVMLTNAAFPPFEYYKNNEIVGVDVDIANEIAKEIGVKLVVKHMDFDFICDYIKAGKGDIGVAGMSITEDRKKQVNFSVEYITSTQYVIVPKGTDTASYKLDGKVIGVQAGTTGDLYYASDPEVIKAKEVKKYKSAIDAASDMILGRVDCVIIDEMPAKKIVSQHSDKLVCYDPGYEPESYAIAVSKDNPELLETVNKVLNNLIKDGKVSEYVIKHSS